MRLIALKTIRLKTSKGPVEIQPGDVFIPVDAKSFIEAGIATPVTQEIFKKTFERLSEHLRQRNYTPENMAKIKELSPRMDDAWEELDYSAFKRTIEEMMAIPGNLRPEGGKPQAAKIYSKVLGEEVWVCNSPEALSLVPEGGIVYLPEEIRVLRGATQEEIKAIHRVKREIGGRLVAVQEGWHK